MVPSILEIVEALQHDPRAQSIDVSTGHLDDRLLEVDISKFRQILWNLLLNSIQASPNGTVVLDTSVEDACYVLRIVDNGKGIAPADLEKVMDPFFTTRAGGTGLGLFVVQQIMQAHKGTIEIDSTVGQGTQVTLTIPLLR